MSKTLFNIEGCSYSTSGREILSNISWSIEQGSLHCIVGPNGAGKTTLLKLLTGEVFPDRGEVQFRGQSFEKYSVASLANLRAVVSQFHETQFPFVAQEVIEMCFDALSPTDFKSATKHRDCAVNHLQVMNLLDKRYDRLSGGERQRVICARALTQLAIANRNLSGKVLLLDEPTSNMDIRHQLLFFKTLRSLCEKGLTVVAVLHDLDQTYQFADAVILISGGKQFDLGHPKKALNNTNIQHLFGVNASLVTTEQGAERLIVSS